MAECNRAVPVKADRGKVLLIIFRSFHFHLLNDDHSLGHFYHLDAKAFQSGGQVSLSLLPTDQILLAERQGVILHASGPRVDGKGLLFVGHSGVGKSTIASPLGGWGQVLCDDRFILRLWPGGFRIHGTWSHGDLPAVSTASATLRAILLLEQDRENQLIRLEDRWQLVGLLPSFVVRPLVDAGWWVKTLDLVGQVAREVPFYCLRFERSSSLLFLKSRERLRDWYSPWPLARVQVK